MGQKTVRFSDLTEQLMINDEDRVRVVVREHPELDGQAVELEARRDEVANLTESTPQIAVIDLYMSGEAEPRRVVMDAAAFDQLATACPMSELLIKAPPAKRASQPRSAVSATSGGGQLDYTTLEHAGKPHRGQVKEAEKKIVREHLDEVNARLATDGMRTIDVSNPKDVERYGLEDLATSST